MQVVGSRIVDSKKPPITVNLSVTTVYNMATAVLEGRQAPIALAMRDVAEHLEAVLKIARRGREAETLSNLNHEETPRVLLAVGVEPQAGQLMSVLSHVSRGMDIGLFERAYDFHMGEKFLLWKLQKVSVELPTPSPYLGPMPGRFVHQNTWLGEGVGSFVPIARVLKASAF